MDTKEPEPLTLAAIQANNPNEGLLDGRIVKIHILYEDWRIADERRHNMARLLGRRQALKSALYEKHLAYALKCARNLGRALGFSSPDSAPPGFVPEKARRIASFNIRAARAEDRKAGRCRCHLCCYQ